MAEFHSEWLEWEAAGKTIEGSVSFVSGLVGRSQKQSPEPGDECGEEGNETQTLVGKEETGESADSGQGILFQERPSRALTKLTKPTTEPETELAELERDWADAWSRAKDGFAVLGTEPTTETLTGAATLELWISDGAPPRPGMTVEDLKDWTQAVYQGLGSARVGQDGRVVLRALPDPSEAVNRETAHDEQEQNQ